ncbi:Emopamil-binding [Penicillium sp. DV-2018c]|nr:Emopamil-binding [Penicillium sp. DV-2018c]
MSTASAASFTLDAPTVLCIAISLSLMPIAYTLSKALIPAHKTRDRILFFWHAYDALTHLFMEGSFLYECFFSYATVAAGVNAPEPYFLNDPAHVYGAAYGTRPTSRLWQEYAKADRRWGGSDLTVISLELLTVFLGGPTAIYICYLLCRSSNEKISAKSRGGVKATLWFAATALATAELYGGFMTFAPEWLSGSSSLATEDPVYLWLYLFFFNVLWVFIPLWVLWEAFKELRGAFVAAETPKERKNL